MRAYLDTVLDLGATPSPQPSPPVGAREKKGVEYHFENRDEIRTVNAEGRRMS
jgi:hypothetical protein